MSYQHSENNNNQYDNNNDDNYSNNSGSDRSHLSPSEKLLAHAHTKHSHIEEHLSKLENHHNVDNVLKKRSHILARECAKYMGSKSVEHDEHHEKLRAEGKSIDLWH